MSPKTTISIIIALLALALIAGVVLGCKRKQEKAKVAEKPITITQEPSSQPVTPKLSAGPKLDSASVWGKKPVLNYLFSNHATLKKLKEELGLTEEQIERIANVVRDETENIRLLYQQSQSIVKDRSLSSEEKKKEIEKRKYNEKVAEIIEESSEKIKEILGTQKYTQFVKWIEKQWLEEHKRHMRGGNNYEGK